MLISCEVSSTIANFFRKCSNLTHGLDVAICYKRMKFFVLFNFENYPGTVNFTHEVSITTSNFLKNWKFDTLVSSNDFVVNFIMKE